MTSMRFASFTVIAATLGLAACASQPRPQVAENAVTPPGIMMNYFGRADFVSTTKSLIPGNERMFTDAAGKPLYVYAKDAPGVSSCTDDCAAQWPPAVADAQAKPSGDWSVIKRADGSRQWAYKGKPLYTSVLDKNQFEPEIPGETPLICAVVYCRNNVTKGHEVDGLWRTAKLDLPEAGRALPVGIEVNEVADAFAQVLVDHDGMTLYTHDGDPAALECKVGGCNKHWIPVPAPTLAKDVGDFVAVDRDSGIRQWTYKGKLLYRFAGDLQPQDARGIGVDPHWKVAVIHRYFVPKNVSVVATRGKGNVLAADGKTLYRRDNWRYEVGGHGVPRSGRFGLPTTGREIGTATCEGECLKTWRPFEAPTGAKPSGYWDIMTRDNGVRQWAYKGYALYTYVGDTKPGDTLGNDTYDFLVYNDINRAVDAPSPMVRKLQGAGAMFFGVMPP